MQNFLPKLPRTLSLRGIMAVGQISLACLVILALWAWWPKSAAAPVGVESNTALLYAESQASIVFAPPSDEVSARTAPSSIQSATSAGAASAESADAAAALQAQIRAALLQRAEAQGIESVDDEATSEAVRALQAAIAASIANQHQQQEASRSTVLIGESEAALTSPDEAGLVEASAADQSMVRERAATTPISLESMAESVSSALAMAILQAAAQAESIGAFPEVEAANVPDPLPANVPVPAPTLNHPYGLELGGPWVTFIPAPPEESDHYWLGLPFPPGYTQQYSPSYQFGSTAGGRYRVHHGVDISNPSGTPVLAMAAGEIIHAGPDDPTLLGPYNNFYGNAVVILLDQRLATPQGEQEVYLLYGHLSEVTVARGDWVESGSLVGKVGMTGIAIGPHLHVEVRVGQNSYFTTVNPALWMRPLEGRGSVAVRVINAEGRTWGGARVNLLRYENGGSRWVTYIDTYRPTENILGDPMWGENGVAANLWPGSYYISVEINGERVGENVQVRAGETTFVELRTRQ